MKLAMLAPYNNLATSVAAALVPTLLGPKLKALEDGEPNKGPDTNPSLNSSKFRRLPLVCFFVNIAEAFTCTHMCPAAR